MDKLIFNIYKEIDRALTDLDFELVQNNYKLNRFNKKKIIMWLTKRTTFEIKELIKKNEIEKEEEKITDKFGYREKWAEIKPIKSIRKKELIDEYCNCLERLAELNSELYNMTELYENEYMIDFNHELFNIFKNKLGYYTKLRNKLKELY